MEDGLTDLKKKYIITPEEVRYMIQFGELGDHKTKRNSIVTNVKGIYRSRHSIISCVYLINIYADIGVGVVTQSVSYL